MPKAYLITGGTGAGKTTYARQLADDLGALRFSIDDWMTTLFWMDSPEPISHAWAMERIGRVEAQMWDAAQQALSRGLDVIFDLGFSTSDHRQKFYDLAKTAGYDAALHWVDIPAEIRWQRVNQRNQDQGETFAMTVTREMFDFMEGIWDAPSDEEMRRYNGERITG